MRRPPSVATVTRAAFGALYSDPDVLGFLKFLSMLPLPSRISRYDIKSLIGTGGMGTLYLARDTNPNTNRLVALKLLNANLDSGDLRERFAREARALAALNHPNIVNIYDSGEFQGSPFIVMEYVRGETLSEKIKRKAPLSLGQKLKLMGELCAGLGHAHEAGMIHRDIKPANLMVDQHGRLKVLDFGIARVSEGSFTRAGLQVTQFNVRIGTPGYMSPEQIETGEIDRRSDIFAVGAVFYELLSNSEAFSGASTRQIENKVLQAQPAPLTSLVPGLDPEIAAIVARALEKDPARRYQDAAAMEEALEQQLWRLGRQDTPAPTERPTPPPQSAGRKSRDSRADVAFQRSAAFYREGAVEAARRFAIEALAEDPNHEGAYTFLERLERQEPDRWPIPRPSLPPPAPGTELRTAMEPPARQLTPVPPTIVSPRRDSGGVFFGEAIAGTKAMATSYGAATARPRWSRPSSPSPPALRSSSCACSVARWFPASCSPLRSRPGGRLPAAASTAARRGLTARPRFRVVSPSSSRPTLMRDSCSPATPATVSRPAEPS